MNNLCVNNIDRKLNLAAEEKDAGYRHNDDDDYVPLCEGVRLAKILHFSRRRRVLYVKKWTGSGKIL